jgi:hypothetical protein
MDKTIKDIALSIIIIITISSIPYLTKPTKGDAINITCNANPQQLANCTVFTNYSDGVYKIRDTATEKINCNRTELSNDNHTKRFIDCDVNGIPLPNMTIHSTTLNIKEEWLAVKLNKSVWRNYTIMWAKTANGEH